MLSNLCGFYVQLYIYLTNRFCTKVLFLMLFFNLRFGVQSQQPHFRHIHLLLLCFLHGHVIFYGDCSLVRRFCSPKVRESEIKGSSFRRFYSAKVRKSDDDFYRPAKSPGISGSLQKWRVISRSPGIVKKTPGIEGIWVINDLSARNPDFCRICPKCVSLLTRRLLGTPQNSGDHGKDSRNSTTSTWQRLTAFCYKLGSVVRRFVSPKYGSCSPKAL